MRRQWPAICWGAFCALLFLSLGAAGQQTLDDSLRLQLLSPRDSTRILARIKLGNQMRSSAPDSAMIYFKKAIEEAEAAGLLSLEMNARKKAGTLCGRHADYAAALDHFHRALEINRQLGDAKEEAGDLSNLGIVYKYLGDYGQSLHFYYQSMAIADSLGDTDQMASIYENIGILYDVMDDFERSMESYLQAMQLKRTLGEDLTSLYNNIGLLKRRTGEFEQSIHYLKLFLESAIASGNIVEEADALNNIGHVLCLQKKYKEAITYNKKALIIYERLKKPRGIHQASLNLGNSYLGTNDLSHARIHVDRMLQLNDEIESIVNQAQTYELASKVFAASKNYQQAWAYLGQYNALKDSLHSQEKTQAFQQWQTRLDVDNKDKQLQKQRIELELLNTQLLLNTRFKQLLGAGVLLFGLIAFFFMHRAYNRHKTNKALIAKNNEIELQKSQIFQLNHELEQRMLRAQINPHFLFNSLSAIQHLISSNDRMAALNYLSRFSALLRQMLEQSNNHRVILAEEIELLKNYLALEALRFESGFTWSVDADPNVDIHSIEVPILLVQPYIENAILHGLVPKSGNGNVSVHFSDEDEYTVCTIEDNGIGRDGSAALHAGKALKHTSRGLAITEKRIAMLSEDFSPSFAVQFVDLFDEGKQPSGTRVIVRIPKILI